MEIVTKTVKIMIVEDELIVSKHIRNHLEKDGYTVTAAVSTGEEAVVRAAENVPDLILMDIRLGGEMDGIEAAAKIRSRFNIPIIYLTAFADSETLKRSRITEPFGYLLKPFEAKALHSTIEVALYKHRMEKKSKESEARFRTLAESAPVGIFQTDAVGDCIYVNEKWSEMGGLSPAEAEGEGWRLALHPEDRERIFSQWYQMVASGEKFALEYRFQTPGGKVTWVFGQAVPLVDDSGNKYGYMGTVSDLSERKKLEEKLLTGRKLESLGILAGGIAHDFNNLLSVILGNVCMVMEEIKPAELHYKMLSMVEKASTEAADLAQKLITFSKGGWLLKKEIPLDTVLNSVLAPTLTGTDCTWEADIAGDLLPVNGDEAQLGQVFSNLLSNAGEAGGNQAAPANKITLRARNLELAEDDYYQLNAGKYVCVTIEDEGVGIQPEHMAKIFDPYFTTKNMGPQKGMGLGLAICYSIVTKHEGAIKIESEPGKGTVVEVLLPAFRQAADTATAANEKKDTPLDQKPRIIVMDDDQNILEVTARMLEKRGCKVETFNEGAGVVNAYKEAANNPEKRPYAAVLLDIIIKKGMGGRETLKKLLKFDPHAPVVAISGYMDEMDIAALKEEGFIEVLQKPYRSEDLQRALSKILPKVMN